MIKTAAIIGTNWGQVHIASIKQLNIQVIAIFDLEINKAQAVANQHNIALATDNLADLKNADLVVIATPAFSHSKVIQAFPTSYLICEKPVVGWQGDIDELPDNSEHIWINYAFSFLHSSQLISKKIEQGLQVDHVILNSQVNLPLNFNIQQWFLETTSHPLSWLIHQFGKPTLLTRHITKTTIQLQLRCANTLIEVNFSLAGDAGIYHHIKMRDAKNELSYQGCYRPRHTWCFQPVTLNNMALNQGEYSEQDCWLEANARSLMQIVSVLNGEQEKQQALTAGCFNIEKALSIETLLTRTPHV